MFTTDEGEGWQQLGEGIMPSSSKDAGVMMDGFQKVADQSLHGVLGGSTMPDFKDALTAMYSPQPMELGSSALPKIDFFDSGAAGSAVAAPGGGAESLGMQAGPGTIETLQAPGIEQATAMANGAPAGLEGSYFKPMDASVNVGDAASPLGDIGKTFTEIMSKMGDMLGSMMQGPMGLLGGLLNFFLNVFSQILSTLGQFFEETARAAASVAAEAWKKQLGAAT